MFVAFRKKRIIVSKTVYTIKISITISMEKMHVEGNKKAALRAALMESQLFENSDAADYGKFFCFALCGIDYADYEKCETDYSYSE